MVGCFGLKGVDVRHIASKALLKANDTDVLSLAFVNCCFGEKKCNENIIYKVLATKNDDYSSKYFQDLICVS